MSRHLVLLPAPEAEWAQLPPEDHEKGMRSHEQFHRDLAAGFHLLETDARDDEHDHDGSRASAVAGAQP